MFAKIISRIFDPILVFALLILVEVGRSGMAYESMIKFLTVFLFLMLLPPVIFLVWAIKNKKVSNWDVSNRAQRVRVLGVFTIFLLIDYFVVKYFANSFVEQLFFFFIVWFLGFFAITLFWKVSGHVAALTLAGGLLIKWFGWSWWPIILTIPLVGWARVVSKNHTLAQVIVGIIYSSLLLWFV